MRSEPWEPSRQDGDPRAETAVPVGCPTAPFDVGLPELAPWGLRVMASTLDTVALGGLSYLALLGITWTANAIVPGPGSAASDLGVPGMLEMLAAYVVILGLWIWNRAVRQGLTGQSLGKRALGIRLVSASTGRPVGPVPALGRDLAHLWDWLFSVGFLWPLWDAKRQTFADKISNTVVIRSREAVPITPAGTAAS